MRVRIVCLPVRGALWRVLLQHSIMLRLFSVVECGIARFLCVMRVFEVRASSSHPIGHLCVKFRFCRSLHFWCSPWNTIAYSITQSLSSAYLMPREPKLELRKRRLILQSTWILKCTICMHRAILCPAGVSSVAEIWHYNYILHFNYSTLY